MNLAKKTVITNSAKSTLGVTAQNVEDVMIQLHKNDVDNFAIGDIKPTVRTITSSNWHLCDGSFLRGNLSNDIKNGLTKRFQFKVQKSALQDTVPTNWTYYADDGYVIINSQYLASGNRLVKLQVYTRNSAGEVVANSSKTLYSSTSSRYSCRIGPVLKCGSYYYALYYVSHDDSEGDRDDLTWYIAYTTNPTGTWSTKAVTPANINCINLVGFYTNGSSVRLEICDYSTFSTSRTVYVYTFSGNTGNITSSTYSNSVDIPTGYSDETNTRAVGNGTYIKRGSTSGIYYKSSFTAGWQLLAKPSWASMWVWAYYINGKFIGIFGRNSEKAIAVIADSITAFSNTSLANLTYYELPNTTVPYALGATSSGILYIDSFNNDGTNRVHLVLVTEEGVKYKPIDTVSFGQPEGNVVSASYTAVFHSAEPSYKTNFYFVGLQYPDMSNEPFNAYMKIATN